MKHASLRYSLAHVWKTVAVETNPIVSFGRTAIPLIFYWLLILGICLLAAFKLLSMSNLVCFWQVVTRTPAIAKVRAFCL
jgi:hypothetical protein